MNILFIYRLLIIIYMDSDCDTTWSTGHPGLQRPYDFCGWFCIGIPQKWLAFVGENPIQLDSMWGSPYDLGHLHLWPEA